ncbi:hypothetical protein Tco_0043638, partial [Tanacetum coccineum]
NNHGHQQQPFNKQNVAKVYNMGTSEKKPYGGNLPKCTGNGYPRKGQKSKPKRQNRARERKERKEKSKSKPSQKVKVNKVKSKSTPRSGFGKSIENQTRKPKLPKVGPPVPT